jgi:hypothetical protein
LDAVLIIEMPDEVSAAVIATMPNHGADDCG